MLLLSCQAFLHSDEGANFARPVPQELFELYTINSAASRMEDKIGGDVSNVRMGDDVIDICSDEKLRVRNRVEKEKRGGIRISLNCDSSIS